MVKVVHISTSSYGGAGRAAFRLHQALSKEKTIHSTFISAAKLSPKQGHDHILVSAKENTLFHRALNKIGIALLHYHKNINLLKQLKGNHECFSMPETDYPLETLEIIRECDIIHLHWVANFINFPSFFQAFEGKKFVWTLHDMNPFMGGYHYRADSLKKTSFNFLDNYIFKLKGHCIRKIRKLIVVAPSRWLYNEATNSKVFGKSAYYKVIQNGIDLDKFKPEDKNIAKGKFGLDLDFPCIMIIADDLKNDRKGFDLFIKAIEGIEHQNFQILTIGNRKLEIKGNFKVTQMGLVHDDGLLSLAYSAADIVVIPSREDNLPNTLLESFACGTPVLGFKVGGLLDWIVPGFNGFLAAEIDEQCLQTEIENFLNDPGQFNSVLIRDFAVNNFSLDLQASEYSKLYKSILSEDFDYNN